jgi:RNA polymerase sigma-70 factor (ECF subfamily)
MSFPDPLTPSPSAGGGSFAATHWSLVVAARDRAAPQAAEALAELCRAYWYPLYVFIRRRVGSADLAQDLTQEFFTRLLTPDFLAAVDPARGKFRAFLLVCCKNFLANAHDREHAQKRGGGRPMVALDFSEAADRYRREPAHDLTAEKVFERRWALTLLDRVLDRLGQEYQDAGKGELYDRLKIALLGAEDALSYRQIGAELNMRPDAVKKAAQRLRQRYGELLRAEIAATVDGPEQAEDEIRALFAVLGS